MKQIEIHEKCIEILNRINFEKNQLQLFIDKPPPYYQWFKTVEKYKFDARAHKRLIDRMEKIYKHYLKLLSND